MNDVRRLLRTLTLNADFVAIAVLVIVLGLGGDRALGRMLHPFVSSHATSRVVIIRGYDTPALGPSWVITTN